MSSSPTLAAGGIIAWGFEAPQNETECYALSSLSMALGTVNASSVSGVTVAVTLYDGDEDSGGRVRVAHSPNRQ